MKKIFAVVSAVLMTLLFAACAGAPVPIATDRDKPWGKTNAYERGVYAITIFERVIVTDSETGGERWEDGEPIGSGSFTQEFSVAGNSDQATLTSALDVTWDDTEKARENRNAHDRSAGSVTFYTSDCTPVSSEKTMTLSDRTADGKTVNNSYAFTADYNALTANVKFGKQNAGSASYLDEKEFPIESGLIYDNEQLFYLVRAFSGLTPGAQLTFPLSSIIDLYGQDKSKPDPVTMLAQVSPDAVRQTPGEGYFSGDVVPPEGAEPAEGGALSCYDIAVVVNDPESGPPHRFFVTDPGTKFNTPVEGTDSFLTTSKLVAGYEYLVFDKTGANIYRFEYKLTGYTNTH